MSLWSICKSGAAVLALAAGFAAAPAPEAAADPYIGTTMVVAFNYCPRGWTEANGQLLPISQNTAAFSLFGTTYGGDGRTTFGVPDLRGRAPVHAGSGPGLANVGWGEKSGTDLLSLNVSQLPPHQHIMTGSNAPATKHGPGTDVLATAYYQDNSELNIYSDTHPAAQARTMDPGVIAPAGQGVAFDNRDPFLVMRTCIALFGNYPPRP